MRPSLSGAGKARLCPGPEDNIYCDHDRRELATNRQLVERIVRIAGELQRPIATPDDARVMLGLPVAS